VQERDTFPLGADPRRLVDEALHGEHIYYVRGDGVVGTGPFEVKRVSVHTREVELLATIDAREKFAYSITPGDDAVYLFLDEGIRSLGFILRIELPDRELHDAGAPDAEVTDAGVSDAGAS
jgi:hypothetical protein